MKNTIDKIFFTSMPALVAVPFIYTAMQTTNVQNSIICGFIACVMLIVSGFVASTKFN